MDEISLGSITYAAELDAGEVRTYEIDPEILAYRSNRWKRWGRVMRRIAWISFVRYSTTKSGLPLTSSY